MKLREIIKGVTIASDVSCFINTHRTRENVKIDLGFVSKDRKQIFVMDLSTADAMKLMAQLTAAFELTPLTPAEVINRQEHHSFLREKEQHHVG